MSSAFNRRDVDQYADSLAAYLPNDELFAAKNYGSSNLRKFIKGLAYTLFNVNGYIKEFADDYTPDVTQNFIEEWEQALGIPDDCFVVDGMDLEDRQLQVIAKLSYMAVQTNQDFVDLASWFGYTVTVTPGIDDTSGATSGLTDNEKRFTIVIDVTLSTSSTFPLTFPITFGSSGASFLTCLYNRVRPANCQVLFNYV